MAQFGLGTLRKYPDFFYMVTSSLNFAPTTASVSIHPPSCAQCHRGMRLQLVTLHPRQPYENVALYKCEHCGLMEIVPDQCQIEPQGAYLGQ
jgi:hypothetical protein